RKALGFGEAMNEGPESCRIVRKALPPCVMTRGDLPLGGAFLDAGSVARKPRLFRRDLDAGTVAVRKERAERERGNQGQQRGRGVPRQLVAQGGRPVRGQLRDQLLRQRRKPVRILRGTFVFALAGID